MRIYTKIAALLALLLFMCVPAPVGAAADETRIESFDVDITVREDNSYHVAQKIRMSFSEYGGEHGAFETIELRPEVFFMEDGEFYERNYRVDVSNIEVNQPFETSVDDGELRIRIGDPDVTVEGRTIDYEISYDYNAGDDGFRDFDMFYYAVIGNGWQMPIESASFAIHMPKEFDPEKVGFSTGWSGSSGYDPNQLAFEVNGEEITGRILRPLEAYEGVWIRISLPAGYFDAVRILGQGEVTVLWGSAIAFAAGLVLFLIFRPRRQPVATIEVCAPPELTSADVGYIIDGTADVRDVLSLLMYWADKGHIKIVEIAPDKPGKKSKDLLFVKLHDLPPTANDYETLMFDALFESGPRVSTKDLKYEFYSTIQATIKRIGNKFTDPGKRVFDPVSKILCEVCGCLSMAPVAFMSAVSAYYASYETVLGIIIGIFTFLGGFFLTVFCTSFVRNRWSEKRSSRKGQAIGFIIAAAVFYFIVFIGNVSCFGAFALIPIVASLALMLLAPRFIRRTDLGLMWTGKILGLRRFIERAEKDRLEALAEENPSYFYNVLPYAYVLGVTDVWSERFEGLATPPPSWYVGADFDTFSSVYITTALMNSMNRARSSLTAQRGSSGGGSGGGSGFSGGGFSGGGFGGSGGGSW